MTTKEIDEARRFVWNYKYRDGYDEDAYDVMCRLIRDLTERPSEKTGPQAEAELAIDTKFAR